ncbi:retrovirus-related Pol polyprotein from transposon 412 [Trichonephila clavipes]|nr:retrovirus-related Pol polyprotein from transposon 412 [Trichonephila clavipes]
MKTLQKVCERFYWNNMWSDVEKCCRLCDPRVARKCPKKRTRGRLQLYNVGAPFERIAFDILGPLPRSSDGNNILVVMDYFTLWPEAYPISDQEASTVAEVQHCISQFGVLLQLHSDQGRNFGSAVCKKLCEILTINKSRTTTLHPQSDGMVERFKQTILNSLSPLVSSNQQDWDKKLPFFLLTYRSAIHETTSYSPSLMLFGLDVHLPADLLFNQLPDAPLALEEYIEQLQALMEETHHLVRERIGMASEKMKTQYNARATGHDFHESDKVWLWNPKHSKGLSPKLQPNWEGPYTVLKKLNDVVVLIQKPHSKPKELPPVEDLQISVQENELEKLGEITGIVDKLVVIHSFENLPALDEGSVLFLSATKPLGKVYEVFGPVSKPFYSVRFNSNKAIVEKGITLHTFVLYTPKKDDLALYVLIDQLKL